MKRWKSAVSFKKLGQATFFILFRKWVTCNLPTSPTIYLCLPANPIVRSERLLLNSLLLSLAPSCHHLSLLSQGHTLINTSGLLSFCISWNMRTHRSCMHTHTLWSHMPVALSVDWGISSLASPHTAISTYTFNQTVVTYNQQELCMCTYKHVHEQTCSWYSMPIDNVLMRIAIMIPLLKYLLPTIRSSLARSPAQQRSYSRFFGSDTCRSPRQGLLLWLGLLFPWHELWYPWCRSSVSSLAFSLSLRCW